MANVSSLIIIAKSSVNSIDDFLTVSYLADGKLTTPDTVPSDSVRKLRIYASGMLQRFQTINEMWIPMDQHFELDVKMDDGSRHKIAEAGTSFYNWDAETKAIQRHGSMNCFYQGMAALFGALEST